WDIYEVGPGSGIYKTTDGGDHWTQLKNGLPRSDMGKIGIAVSPADPNRVYATIGGDDGGIFRSDDAGETWRLLNGSFEMHSRQYYYGHIFADPKDVDTVYTFTSKDFYKSTDGGKTWGRVQTPHGDYHGLWIDPNDNQRMVNGNDGGATVTFDGGKSWSSEMNQPTAQFYTVRADNDFPYHIYGAQQDNTTVAVSSTATSGAIGRGGLGGPVDFTEVGGGESGYVVPDPRDPNIIYAGAYWGLLTRYDRRTGATRNITVWPDLPGGRTGSETKYRFQWTFPIAISAADPTAIYAGGNVVFKSVDQGQSWKPISPDLTRNDQEKEKGGRLEDIYDTVFTIAPSPIDKNTIWAGSDDGLVHLTRDGGKSWLNVTPPEVQPWTRINVIEASAHDAATAYVAANRYQMDDFRPYIYRTHDYGKTWTLVNAGIPQDTFVRSVRQDAGNPNLLFAATETGVYASFNDGQQWESLQFNLPVVPVTDLAIKNGDLVASTQGRAFWVLDDITPLEQMANSANSAPLHIFAPRPAYRGSRGRGFGPRGATEGVVVDYTLGEGVNGPVTLTFMDEAGKPIKSFTSMPPSNEDRRGMGTRGGPGRGGETPLRAEPGLNRFVWDLRYPDAEGIDGGTYLLGGSLRGPEVAPGKYQVKITAGGQSAVQSFEVRKDPRVPTTDEEYRKQLAFLLAARDRLSECDSTINRIKQVQHQLQGVLQASSNGSLTAGARKLNAALEAEAQQLYEPRFTGFDDQTLVYPLRLNNRLAALQNYGQGDYAPTDQDMQVLAQLTGELQQALSRVKQTMDVDLPSFNAELKAAGLPQLNASAAESSEHE
ncbi:MAG TPA: hypothetical protein VE998_13425, partial [Terriglobales bacterium]|nr:hypothetical protein [Terriglobales bacterium]